MGLYSSNRFQSLNESDEIYKIYDEIDNCKNPNIGSIYEYSIALLEFDKKLFDTVITQDFNEVYNKQTYDRKKARILNEANSKEVSDGIKDKIIQALEKLKDFMVQHISAFIKKIQDFFNKDAATYKKYADIIQKAAKDGTYDNYPGLQNFTIDFGLDKFDILKTLDEDAEDAVNWINSGLNAGTLEKLKNMQDTIKSLNQDIIDYKIPTQEVWKPTDKDINMILDIMTNGKTKCAKDIKDNGSKIINSACDKMMKAVSNSKVEDGLDSATANEMYSIIKDISSTASKAYNLYTNLYIEQIKNCRRAMISLGEYAKKHSEEATEEAVIYNEARENIISEANSQYVYSFFGYC